MTNQISCQALDEQEQEELELQKHYAKQERIIKKFEKSQEWLYDFDIIHDLKVCEWKHRGLRDHRWQKKSHGIIINLHDKKQTNSILCQYCYLIWIGESIDDLKKNGMSKEEITKKLIVPPRSHYQNSGGYLDLILLSQHSQKRPCKKCFWKRDKTEQLKRDRRLFG